MERLMYLLDSNILLEALLEQQNADNVRTLLRSVDLAEFAISDLSLHSIGIILFKLEKSDAFSALLRDLVLDGINVLSLKAEELENVVTTARRFDLDFDDSYQYAVAEKYGLVLISFDKHFDRTELGRKEPGAILASRT